MLPHIIHYLHSNQVTYRLSNHPAPERIPAVAHRVPPGGVMVCTRIVVAAGQVAILCIPEEERISLPRLRILFGVPVLEADSASLEWPYSGVRGPVPPLGGEVGALVVLDESVAIASALSFPAFSEHCIIDIPMNEFARLERPRIDSFIMGGELPPSAERDTYSS